MMNNKWLAMMSRLFFGWLGLLFAMSAHAGPDEVRLAQVAMAMPVSTVKFATGIDQLAAQDFAPLTGKRVAVITNHTGRDLQGNATLDLLRLAANVRVVAIFSPEHGLSGKLDQKISSGIDPDTGLPVYSLYGEHKRPSEEMLKGVDALVFDIQDAGVRFYTYITTMAYAMEAAAKAGIDFYVLDRPNPINSRDVQGPVLDADLKSFVGYYAMPIRHGLTVGELAGMFNAENHIGVRLHVIPMQGYQRSQWFDDTGMAWVPPSPNLRSLTQAILYPGVAMVESANVSVGRGTDSPFEILGAPWLKADDLAAQLNARAIPGVRFSAVGFTPKAYPYKNKVCQGVRIELFDRDQFDAALLGLEIASALYHASPLQFQLDNTVGMIGSRDTIVRIKAGEDPRTIAAGWQQALNEFNSVRAKYLLY